LLLALNDWGVGYVISWNLQEGLETKGFCCKVKDKRLLSNFNKSQSIALAALKAAENDCTVDEYGACTIWYLPYLSCSCRCFECLHRLWMVSSRWVMRVLIRFRALGSLNLVTMCNAVQQVMAGLLYSIRAIDNHWCLYVYPSAAFEKEIVTRP
jgi:hypothetical protein